MIFRDELREAAAGRRAKLRVRRISYQKAMDELGSKYGCSAPMPPVCGEWFIDTDGLPTRRVGDIESMTNAP